MINGFLNGLFAIVRAWTFLYRHPGLLRYAIAPFAINVIVFCAVFYFANAYFSQLVEEYLVYGDAWWWSALEIVAQAVLLLMLLVLSFFTFTVVGNFIAAPFNDVLSEKTENMVCGSSVDEPFSFRLLLRDVGRSLGDEVKKLTVFLAAMGVLLIINFIPIVGPPVFMLCSIGLTLYFLVIEYTGFVCSRKRISFARQRAFIRTHLSQSLGFGTAVMLTLMLPLIQFLTIPSAVVAATLFWINHMDGVTFQQPDERQ